MKNGNNSLYDIYSFVRKFVGRVWKHKLDHESLTFLVFLFISVGFWCVQSLREERIVPLRYQLEIRDVPSKIIFTSDVPREIVANVKGRGFYFLEYYFEGTHKVSVSFSDIEKSIGGHAVIDPKTWKQVFARVLPDGVELDATSLPVVDFFFSTGYHKRVPLVFGGKVNPGTQYLITGMRVYPDSVDVYAPLSMFDSINAAYTLDTVFSSVEDSICCTLPIVMQRGAKAMPDSATIMVGVDLYTEKVLEVPIYCENIPQNMVLRTFPSKAKVKCHVSMTLFDSIKPDDFIVVVDYNSLVPNASSCKLYVREYPNGVCHVTLQSDIVEYVIEHYSE